MTTQALTITTTTIRTINVIVAMSGLSEHTQRAYGQWIVRYLADVNKLDTHALEERNAGRNIDLVEIEQSLLLSIAHLPEVTQRAYLRFAAQNITSGKQHERETARGGRGNKALPSSVLTDLNVDLATSSLNPGLLRAWLGTLKASGLGKQSLSQAKASIIWLAQLLGDADYLDYAVVHRLSRIKAPKAESGQRDGTWLTVDEVRRLIYAIQQKGPKRKATIARDTAIIVLMVACGLRREEITTLTWDSFTQKGGRAVIRIHGKGEKLRTVKLPGLAAQVIEDWKEYHPRPTEDRPVFTNIWKGEAVTTNALSGEAIHGIVKRAVALAGIPRVSPHDLRRTFARGAYEAGASFELIRQALGHANTATTEKYVNAVLVLDNAATDIWTDTLQTEQADHE